VLGGLGLLTEGSVDFPLPQDAAALVAVYVAPRARGLGVGDRLVEAAKDPARELGRRRIVLEVGSFNDHAIALYQRHGFRFTGATAEQLATARPMPRPAPVTSAVRSAGSAAERSLDWAPGAWSWAPVDTR